MITINVIEDQISGSFGETPFTVPYSKEKYDAMQKLAEESSTVESMKQYNEVLDKFRALAAHDFTKTVETDCEYIHVNKATGQFFLKNNDVVSSIPMPQALVDRIMRSIDMGVEFEPLVKMWIRFLRNPILARKTVAGTGGLFSERFFSFVNAEYVHPTLKKELMEKHGLTHDIAAKRATMYQMKITKEGLLNGYKVSEEYLEAYDPETGDRKDRYQRTFDVDTGEIKSDGKPDVVEDRLFIPAVQRFSGDPFTCEGDNGRDQPGHFIKVGCVHRLENWDKVNTDDARSCVRGLHVGGLQYINHYQGEIHNIFVDPMHVGAVPVDGDGAIRVLQYFVHSSLAGVNGSIYHSSKYAAKTDEEWADMRAEAIKQSDEAAKEAIAKKETIKGLD